MSLNRKQVGAFISATQKIGLSAFLAFGLVAAVVMLTVGTAPMAYAQTQVSGDISGTVTDQTGAIVNNATIAVAGDQNGITKSAKTSAAGTYRVSLLSPGTYKLTVTAPGFQTTKLVVIVTASSVVSGDAKLKPGVASDTVTVTGEGALLQTENSNLSTTFNLEQIDTIPNPGNDVTYYAQTAPGVIMNTGGGYGNFSVFGLPGTSNNFTVNGAQQNDPFLNLNNSGPSNLLLGQNDVAEVNVVSNAYDAAFGSFAGVQLNETTRTGSNKYHGNLTYYYNSALLNANNWFNKQAGNKRAHSVNNQWALGFGGPIFKDKTFFFGDFEGIRFVTTTPTFVEAPSFTYDSHVAAPITGTLALAGQSQQIAYYNSLFALYNTARPSGGITAQDIYTDSWEANPKVSLREGLIAARIDHNLTQKDHLFMHVEYDNGRQPSYVDPLHKEWSDTSKQPEWQGQLAWSRQVSTNITNQFLFTAAHYSAIFQSVNYGAGASLLPYALLSADNGFYPLNYLDYDFPQGRNATQYQFEDDFSYTRGKHTFKGGYLFKRDDVSNFDLGIYNNPLVETFFSPTCSGSGCFNAGQNYINRQIFPRGLNMSSPILGGLSVGRAPDTPIGFYNEAGYIEDVWKPTTKLTLTLGLRIEHNSDPYSKPGAFSRLNAPFFTVAASDLSTTAYNSILTTGYKQAFPHLTPIVPEPRIGVNYQLGQHTVLRGGFGMFADVFPAQVTDYLVRNAPNNARFQSQYSLIEPGVTGNGFSANQAANTAFHGPSGYTGGGSYSTINAAAPAFTRPNIYTSDFAIHDPTYEEWNLEAQHEFPQSFLLKIGYVGNHGFHEPVTNNSANAYNPGGAPSTINLPSARPATSFGEVVNLQSNANSNFNGLIVTLEHRSKLVNASVNWSWSHSMDMVSNGGFLGFTSSSLTGQIDPRNLRYNYGNADYDARQSINGNYLVNIPHTAGPKLLVDNWQVAGTIFFRTGFPFTVTDNYTTGYLLGGYYAAIPASFTPGTKVNHHCGRAGLTVAGCFADTSLANSGYWGGPGTPYFETANTFHDQERNQFTGPGYFDTDIAVLKGFQIGSNKAHQIQFGAQVYNLFNHPNFANPDSGLLDSQGFGDIGFGQIHGMQGSPTGIYGSGLGGDTSIRTLQFKLNATF